MDPGLRRDDGLREQSQEVGSDPISSLCRHAGPDPASIVGVLLDPGLRREKVSPRCGREAGLGHDGERGPG